MARNDIDQLPDKAGPGRPKGSKDIKPRIARAFWKGLRLAANNKGKTLPEYFAEQVDKDFNKTLSTVSKFLPKTVQHEGSVNTGTQIVLMQYDAKDALPQPTVEATFTEASEPEVTPALEEKPVDSVILQRIKDRVRAKAPHPESQE